MTTAELTIVGLDRGPRIATDRMAAIRERLAGREGIDMVGLVREWLAGLDVSELMGGLRERPADRRRLAELLSALEQRLSAQGKVRFRMHDLGVSLEGSAGDIFALAAELHALPLELGMPEARTFLKLESSSGSRRARGRANGHAPVPAPALLLAPTTPVVVKIAGLEKTYGDGETSVRALKGIDLEIHGGEFVAVMGPSGSGKSTLMHILGALETASAGTIEIGGVSYGDLGDREQTELRRDRIGFVFQFFNLLKTLTAEENVMLPSMLAGDRSSALRERARELLEMVGLGERSGHLPSQMSGGEQQRVSIARALMRSPELLLADEPTGNLDSRNSAAVLDMLARLQTERGHTILMVTHDPVAASRATRVVFLKDGLVAGELPGGDSNRIVARFSELAAARESG